MTHLKLFALGSPRLEKDSAPLVFDTRKNLALLVYLAVTGTPQRRDSLITLLWPELDPSRARAGLRRNLSTLRKALSDEWLLVDREMVSLDAEADFCFDVARFRALSSSMYGHDHPRDQVCPTCLADLTTAVELYRGDFLAGFSLRDSAAFDAWQRDEAERLRQELAFALERLVHGHSGTGDHASAIPYAQRWLALDPLHEPAQRNLMELYARSGQRPAALRQYQECERLLQEELGLAPAAETTALFDRIQAGVLDREMAAVVPHNLPAHPSPFVGREGEIRGVVARLREPDCRLLTLVGPGGIGKTRLALEAAARVRDLRPAPFERGVFLVRLDPLQSISAIVPAIAEAIDFHFSEGEPLRQQLLDYLHKKRMLLLLDNFEHLLGGLDLVTEILQKAPDLRIMVTSRVNLNLEGEQLMAVEGMRTPDPDAGEVAAENEAVKLFVQRARGTRLGSEWSPTTEELLDLIRICGLVEGMPLGILLAAAWAEMLSPAEIAAEIERGLDFLSSDQHDLPTRQRSIRAVFDHSWSLLSEAERDLFQQLCVFQGSFSQDAAQVVAGASLFQLRALLGKSLLEHDPAGRYEIHALLRGYGLESLERSPAGGDPARDRHSAYFTERLAGWSTDLRSERQLAAISAIKADLDNVRSAWAWAATNGPLSRIDLALDGLCTYYEISLLLEEGMDALHAAEVTVERIVSAHSRRLSARILVHQAKFKSSAGDRGVAYGLLRRSLAILEGPELADHDVRREKARALYVLGRAVENMQESIQLYHKALTLFRELADDWWSALTLQSLAWAVRNTGDYERSRRLAEECLEIMRALGDVWTMGLAQSLLGTIAWRQGRYEESEQLLRETITAGEKLQQPQWVAYQSATLGVNFIVRGEIPQGVALLKEWVGVLSDIGSGEGANWWRIWLADGLVEMGEYLAGRLEAEASHRYFVAHESAHGTAHVLVVLGRAELGIGMHNQAHQRLEEAVATLRKSGNRDSLSYALVCLAYPKVVTEDFAAAEQLIAEGLALGEQIGALNAFVFGVPALALLRARQGRPEDAIELYAVALTHPRVSASRWFQDLAGAPIAIAAAGLPPDRAIAARERGQGRDLKDAVREYVAQQKG